MHEGPVVVGVDGSEDSLRALERAVELVERDRATGGLDLVVVFVRGPLSVAYMAPGGAGEVTNALDELEERARQSTHRALENHFVTCRFVVRQGDPARQLMKEAEEQKAAAIVVGGHRHSMLGSVLTQSVDSSLVHSYKGTLMIIRGDADPLPAEREGSSQA